MLLGALQMRSSTDAATNLKTIADACADAKGQGVDYLQLPEMAVMFAEDHASLKKWAHGGEAQAVIQTLSDLAKQFEINLHVGSLAVASPSGKCLNRSFLFGRSGQVIAQYDKIHLFDADVIGDAPYRESNNFDAGEQAVVANVDNVQLGLSICYDVRFPSLYAALRKSGAMVLAVPAALTVPTGQAHWDILLRSRAIETGCYLVAAAQCGLHANGRKTYGHSMIVGPSGDKLAACTDDQPQLIVARFDESLVNDARSCIPTLANERQFSLSVNQNAAQ